MTVLQITVSPYIKPMTPDVRTTMEFAFINGVMLTIAAIVMLKSNLFIGMFLAFSVFSAHYPISDYQSRQTLVFVLSGVLLYHFMVHNLTERKALNAICIIALLNAFFLLLQALNLDFTDRVPKYESIISGFSGDVPVGLMSCPNEVSAIIAICFAAFLREKWKWCIPLLLFGLWQAHTFAGPMSIVAGSVVVLFLYVPLPYPPKFMLAFLLCGSLMLYAVFCDIPDVNWRLQTWKIGAKIYSQRPWFGFGLGHWQNIFTLKPIVALTDGKAFIQAHNEYLQGLFEMGIPFLVCLAGYVFGVMRNWRKVGIICMFAFVAMAQNSFVFFTFHNPLIAGVCVTWLALIEIRRRQSQPVLCSQS